MPWWFLLACKPAPTEVSTPATQPPTPSDYPVTSYTHPVVEALRDGVRGWDLREGRLKRLIPSECGPVVEASGICMGNNPLTPYLAPVFEEDEHLEVPIGAFQLANDEAVVFVGEMPPGRYFSFQGHLHSRDYEGDRRLVVSTISPALHHRNLKHAGPGIDAQGQLAAVVFAANRTVAESVRRELDRHLYAAGVGRDVVNVVPIPFLDDDDLVSTRAVLADTDVVVTPMVMGYAPTDDIYGIAIRIAGIDFDIPYLDVASTPLAVFKVGFDDPPAYDPFDYPLLPPPRDASKVLDPALDHQLGLLVDAVRDQLPEGSERFRLRFETLDMNGFRCVDGGHACGNHDDALYMQSIEAKLGEDSTGGVYVIGALHTAIPEVDALAPQLAYSGLALRNVDQRMGIEGWYDDTLRGSARALFPDGVPGIDDAVLDRFYVRRFARSCGDDPICTVVGTGPLEVPGDHRLNFTERAYLDLGTNTGPHRNGVLAPYTLFYGASVLPRPLQLLVEVP